MTTPEARAPIAEPAESPALTTIREAHTSSLSFNVMPGKPVTETLHVREYRVGERYAEAHFDREYSSSMQSSPSHLIFLSTLVHTQKLLYVSLCHEWGLPYDPAGKELFKMWPTKVAVRIPELLTEESNLVQRLWVRKLQKFDDKTHRVVIETRVGSLVVDATIPTFFLGSPRKG